MVYSIYYSRISKIKPNRRSKTPAKPYVSVESVSIKHQYNSHLKMQKRKGRSPCTKEAKTAPCFPNFYTY